MSTVKLESKSEVAEYAAATTVELLRAAIAEYGSATWVLAGGTSPSEAYSILAEKYKDALEWESVNYVIGDERFVPADDKDSNWKAARDRFLFLVPTSDRQRPTTSGVSVEDSARDYAKMVDSLPRDNDGHVRLDCVWLGIGEDGHTLSLFPGRTEIDSDESVVVVSDSPKPPPTRITLTRSFLAGTRKCLIFAVGEGKSSVVADSIRGKKELPIARVADFIAGSGGDVAWVTDPGGASGL